MDLDTILDLEIILLSTDTYKGPYHFYNGTVTLWFDADKHIYLRELPVSGEKAPQDGVTTIIKIIDKSDALVPWAAKQVYLRALELIPIDESTIFNSDPSTKQILFSELVGILDKAKKAPREIKESAGDIGSIAHQCLEDSIKHAIKTNSGIVKFTINNPEDARALSCVNAAYDWMQTHNVRWIETERKVYSLKHQYAGTMDGLALVNSCSNRKCCKTFSQDVLSLIDWKSSNNLWPEYCLQVAAYKNAHEEEFDSGISDCWILRLGKEDGKFESWHLEPEDFKMDLKAFLLCLELGRAYKMVKERVKNAGKKYRKSRAQRL